MSVQEIINRDLKKCFIQTIGYAKSMKLAEIKVGSPVFIENKGFVFVIAKGNGKIRFDTDDTVDYLTATKMLVLTK